ncbi:leucine-rich repeats and immunoglobulin-like domains protein 2 isoform X1 [Monodon monoceros]|uniref:Leucine-rich repeats and immunoglobulin-like domains protein 2 n=3 Tax=Monodon monoceros TaxID=40151 RepID=A0A8C6C1E8_MONMO|nr:LOW QUALITY PROTEIN: leucine-rich repeats and immunoglobulin-like domains protein 2 [Delphinapterus leucas]XP_029084252.1 leucine-rich repeats and immunoglobulin-like domains protein 2 isoform X1 [Monodon monoceros]
MAPAPQGVREEPLLECGSGLLSRLLFLAQAVLLLLPAARAGLCPAPCSCRIPLLDCSRRKLPAPSWRALSSSLPPDAVSLDLSHNRLSNWNISLESQTLQEVKMNYNELTEIPYFGEPTTNITLLSLVHNIIPEINAEAFQFYPALESLDLSSNIISEVKTSSFPRMQLKYLNLSNNRITILEAGCFDNLSSSLLVVKLNRNRISMIPPKIFKLPHLQFLELKRNRIKVVEGLTFQGLDSLRSLKMQRNGISKLKDGAFFGLDNMEELELEHNNLTEVNKGWLYGLRMLQQLYVSQNAVERISPDAWEFCQRLSELDLSYNQLTRLDESAFVGLSLLERLNLGDNRVTHIADGVFRFLSNLQTLNLRNNEISWAIEDASEAFAGLTSLTKLILQGNQIKSITKKAFIGLESLEHLDLNNNAIMSIQENAFSQTRLKELILNTSSLLCDCHLKWLLQWLVDNNFQHSVNVSCAHPEWLAGQSILNVDLKDFVCDDFLKPQIRTHPETTVALRSMNVTLTCTAVSSSDSPMSTLWRKDSEILYDADIENFVRYQQQAGEALEYTSVLHLFNVNFTDEGKYQCIITNHFGSNYSHKAKLTVNEMPSFLKTPMDLTIRTGAMARLECAAEGHPAPQISWQKDGGTDFPAARERRMHVMPEDDVFFIANVKIEDMGIYSCMAQNIAGGLSANASLIVLETPSFIRPLEDKTVTRGETAVLQCIAGGSPAPRLNWTKDDGPLLVTERHFFAAANQLLIIVDAGLEDAGKYTCIMSNTLGTERGHIYLNVISTPNCDSSQSSIGHEDDGWTTVGIVIIVVVCCVVGTSLIWVIVIYHMRRKNEDYSITNTDELNLPADIPSYLSSQGTLSEPQEGYSNSEAGSHQQLMPPANGYLHKGADGGTGTRVICSDCYDNANIYSRTREYCPYTYIAEEDVLDQTLSSLMVQMPKETYLAHLPQDATTLESLVSAADREMSAFPTNHERINEKKLSSTQKSSEPLQRPLWNISKEPGMPHPPLSQQSVFESPQLHQNEGLAESDPDCSTSPMPCHRLHDHTFDFSRTRNIQDGSEGT